MGAQGNDLTLKLGFDIAKFQADIGKAMSAFADFQSTLTKGMQGFFAHETLKRVGSFALEVSKLAGEAQGVREAFDRLPGSIRLMHDLKEATHGTVDELQLMKRSVMASNFDISLKELPKLLEFATLRAKQTGQSVDYLVDSIVTGIGRKSKLILDNLGISAVQLTEALGGASAASSSIAEVTEAVGKIIEKNLPMMGQLSENASTKIDRLSASWTNLKIAIGDAANETGFLGNTVDALTASMDLAASKNLSFWEKLGALVGGPGAAAGAVMKDFTEQTRKLNDEQKLNASVTRQAQQAIKEFGNDVKAIGKAYAQNVNVQAIVLESMRLIEAQKKKDSELLRNEKNLTEELNGLREDASIAIGKERAALNLKIEAIEKEIEALRKLGAEQIKITKFNPDNFGPGGEFPNITGLGSGPSKKKKGPSGPIGDGPLFDEESWTKMQNKMEKTARTAARIGAAIGEGLGAAISGAQSFAEAMAQMASSVIDSLMQIIMMNALAFASKFGIGGLIAAVAGLGLVRSLVNNAVKKGSPDLKRGQSNYDGRERLVATVSGRDLNFILKNQATYDSRVKTT